VTQVLRLSGLPIAFSAMSANARAQTGGDVRTRRRASGISQQRLAELAHCSLSMVRLLESGYQPESGTVVERIAAALDDEAGRCCEGSSRNVAGGQGEDGGGS
jgi:transcriptional regulator with XRE-family HTH domain